MTEPLATYNTGASRTDDTLRDDPEGFLSPIVMDRYCQYMTEKRRIGNGELRASDNWQQGIPVARYMKSLWRHFLSAWTRHRGFAPRNAEPNTDMQDDLCAMLFNVSGALHVLLERDRRAQTGAESRTALDSQSDVFWESPSRDSESSRRPVTDARIEEVVTELRKKSHRRKQRK